MHHVHLTSSRDRCFFALNTQDILAGDTRITIPELLSDSVHGLVADEQLISRLEICMSEWASVMQSFLQQEAHRQILGKGKSPTPGSRN